MYLKRRKVCAHVQASTANFTVCSDPADPNNFATCTNPAEPPVNVVLSPATCGANCGYALRYCSLVQLSDPVVASITLSFSIPAADSISPYVSAGILRHKGLGDLTAAESREMFAPNPAVCNGPAPWSPALTPTQLSGAYLVCGGLMVLAGLTHAASLIWFRCHARALERGSSGSVERAPLPGRGAELLRVFADKVGVLLAKAKGVEM